jgi:predicted  nucleic acid-binding Zn-ribbon protein
MIEPTEDPRDEKIFELNEEIKRLRNQVTYLQEELAMAEDKIMEITQRFENRVEDLERQVGDALYGD